MTSLPFFGEGDRNYQLWLESQKSPTRVTSLPAPGTHGQRVEYQAAPGVIWVFEYNQFAAGPKWERIGGNPLRFEIGFYQGVAAFNVNQVVGAMAAPIVLPGTYFVRFGAAILFSQVAAINQIELIPAKTGNVSLWTAGQAPAVITPAVAGLGGPVGLLEVEAAGLTAGQTVFLLVKSANNLAFQVYSPQMHILPKAVG